MQVLIPWMALGLLVSAVCRAYRVSLGFLAALLALLWINFAPPFNYPSSLTAPANTRNSWIKELSSTEALLDLGDGRRVVLTAPQGNITRTLAANTVAALRAQEQASGQL